MQALIDALPAAEDISDANADEVSGQLDAIDEAKQALTEEQAARLDLTGYDAAAAAVLALAGAVTVGGILQLVYQLPHAARRQRHGEGPLSDHLRGGAHLAAGRGERR